MDELQQEDWEVYMGGPEDREFKAQNALHEYHGEMGWMSNSVTIRNGWITLGGQ